MLKILFYEILAVAIHMKSSEFEVGVFKDYGHIKKDKSYIINRPHIEGKRKV